MLDKDILQQVKTVFASLKTHISFLLTDNGNHGSQAELTEFLNDLVGCSEQLSLKTRSEADAPFGFSVLREGEPTGIHFRGIPNGHEFTSLLLAVLNADGQGKNLPDAALSRRIAALKTPLDLRTYVSLTCTNCPDVVQALNVMALINPGIRHEMVDGGLFQDEVDALKLQGVPAVFLGDEQIHIGRGDLGMLLDKLEEKAGSHELPEAEAVEHRFDVVVVGGGPAGTSAAVYSARKGLNVAIVADQDPAAMTVILEQAVRADAAVARAGSEFGVVSSTIAVGGQQLTLQGLGGDYTDIFLPLSGEHQANNAAVALAAVEAFFGAGSGRMLDIDTVREGFASVESPGRLERVRATPTVFIDAAHNPHGARALGRALQRDFSFNRLIGVVGVLSDKDYVGVLTELEPVFGEIVCTQTRSPRALDAYELAEHAREIFGEERVHVADTLPSAVELAVELAEEGEMVSGNGVVITGSVVTAGEARTLFGKEPT